MRRALLLIPLACLLAAPAPAATVDAPAVAAPAFVPPAATEAEVIAEMTEAARVLVASLPPDDLAPATFAVGGPEQHYWHWIPAPLLADKTLGKTYAPYGRVGLPVEKMSVASVADLHGLLRVSLSAEGYRKVEQAMRREGGSEPRLGFQSIGRSPTTTPPGGPGWYFFSLFGKVGEGQWGWRLEGHHISLNFEVVGDHVHFTPFMFGHNPSPIAPEASTLSVRLFHALTPAQQAEAQIIATATDPRIPEDMDRSPGVPAAQGAALGQLSADGQLAFEQLVEDFVGNFPEPLVHALRTKIRSQAAQAHLAWYGLLDDAHPHYYRLQGPSFLIQVRHQGLDNGHPHVHTSYRSLDEGSATSPIAP
jgi:hypothetical protein